MVRSLTTLLLLACLSVPSVASAKMLVMINKTESAIGLYEIEKDELHRYPALLPGSEELGEGVSYDNTEWVNSTLGISASADTDIMSHPPTSSEEEVCEIRVTLKRKEQGAEHTFRIFSRNHVAANAYPSNIIVSWQDCIKIYDVITDHGSTNEVVLQSY